MKLPGAYILAIETSCDETAAAVVEVRTQNVKILSNVVTSQIALHRKTFGVVPEIASRAHVEKILAVIEEALKHASLSITHIKAVAVTYGPGLLGSLLVGVETAKAIAYAQRVPTIPVNHLEGHLMSAYADNIKIQISNIKKWLPALGLIVSGGHTELVLIKKPFHYQIIGQTVDDAAGEAFDKIGRILGLPYPGGPAIAAEAAKFKVASSKFKVDLPRPMLETKDFNFSFAGLKTAVLYATQKYPKLTKPIVSAFARETQQAIVEVLVEKTYRAALHYGVRSVLLTGGVSANELLRQTIKQKFSKTKTRVMIAPRDLTTDNAAMIGLAGALRCLAGKTANWYDVKADANATL